MNNLESMTSVELEMQLETVKQEIKRAIASGDVDSLMRLRALEELIPVKILNARIAEVEAGIAEAVSEVETRDRDLQTAVDDMIEARNELKRVKTEILPAAEQSVREAESAKARAQKSLESAHSSLSDERMLVRNLRSELEAKINGTPIEAAVPIPTTRSKGMTMREGGVDPAEQREDYINRLRPIEVELPLLLEKRKEARHAVAVLEQSILRAKAAGDDETSIVAQRRKAQHEYVLAEAAYSAVSEQAERLRGSINRLDKLVGAVG